MLKPRTARKKLLATKLTLSVLLPFVAGGVNVAGFLAIGTYTSHVTGHVTRLGSELSAANFYLALCELSFVGAFTFGVMMSTTLIELARARSKARHCVVLLIEASLLTYYAVVPGALSTPHDKQLMAAGLCLVMGMQNALVTQAFGAVLRTTHLTGICTDLGIEVTRLLFWMKGTLLRHEVARGGLWQQLLEEPEWAQLRTHFSVLASYFGGALGGAFLYCRYGRLSLSIYSLILLVLVCYDMRFGIKRLDL
jgi:uncharacterized membrane protein YoaK (UPF0700 family)